jgi:hypothetical protein
LEIKWIFTLTNPQTGNVGEFSVESHEGGEYTFDNSVSCNLIHPDKVKIDTKPQNQRSPVTCLKTSFFDCDFDWNWEALASNSRNLDPTHVETSQSKSDFDWNWEVVSSNANIVFAQAS